MGSDLVKSNVISKLNEKMGNTIFTIENVVISGTHTHSGPAGNKLYNIIIIIIIIIRFFTICFISINKYWFCERNI
jgi:neutral ceramidase